MHSIHSSLYHHRPSTSSRHLLLVSCVTFPFTPSPSQYGQLVMTWLASRHHLSTYSVVLFTNSYMTIQHQLLTLMPVLPKDPNSTSRHFRALLLPCFFHPTRPPPPKSKIQKSRLLYHTVRNHDDPCHAMPCKLKFQQAEYYFHPLFEAYCNRVGHHGATK